MLAVLIAAFNTEDIEPLLARVDGWPYLVMLSTTSWARCVVESAPLDMASTHLERCRHGCNFLYRFTISLSLPIACFCEEMLRPDF